jgi:hypothetical protein
LDLLPLLLLFFNLFGASLIFWRLCGVVGVHHQPQSPAAYPALPAQRGHHESNLPAIRGMDAGSFSLSLSYSLLVGWLVAATTGAHSLPAAGVCGPQPVRHGPAPPLQRRLSPASPGGKARCRSQLLLFHPELQQAPASLPPSTSVVHRSK